MQVRDSLEQLYHIAFDLRLGELDRRIFEEAGQIMIHIRSNHIHYRFFSPLSFDSLNSHLFELQNIRMRQHFKKLYLPDRGDRKAILLIVHQNLFHCYNLPGSARFGFVYFSKGSLSKLGHHNII